MSSALPSYKEIVDLMKKGMTIEAQEKIMELREAVLELRNENLKLKEQIKEHDNWEDTINKYQFVRTSGGAEVYEEKMRKYFICPSCINKKEIQILQDFRNYTGDYECPGCKSKYPIKRKQETIKTKLSELQKNNRNQN